MYLLFFIVIAPHICFPKSQFKKMYFGLVICIMTFKKKNKEKKKKQKSVCVFLFIVQLGDDCLIREGNLGFSVKGD